MRTRSGGPIPGLLLRLLLAAALGCACMPASARKMTQRECNEGGDFIRNAAMSRDNGITRAKFLDQLEGDLEALRSYPPHLRWFAQDQEDEALLVKAAREVFDAPRPPDTHRSAFVSACMAQAST